MNMNNSIRRKARMELQGGMDMFSEYNYDILKSPEKDELR